MTRLSLILAVAIHTAYAASSQIALTNHNNEVWYGQISVGIPARTFTVLFDTGSADLTLPGSHCGSSCSGHTLYDPSSSSAAQDLGRTFELIRDEGAKDSGEQFTDTVSIGGLTAAKQTIGVATQYSSGLESNQFPVDGILGMAFESISSFQALPVAQPLIAQGQMDKPVFSFKLAASGSELYLGGVNGALFTGNFTYTPVIQQGFWQANVDGIQGNGQTILSNIDAIIDTGSNMISLSPSEAKTFHDALGGTDASSTVGLGFYTFPCNSFPSVSFTFRGTSFPMSLETLNLGPTSSGSSDCVSSIRGDATSSFAVIGTSFLQNVYTSFDIGKSQIGFAKLA
ncbi:hypothetical protein BGZ91_004508 [Linnemannia elongata]|nr:hypothetical protein BGZ91_004508 [Linnemannia elongata]